jgi:type I restriction enzyme, S subunit
MPYSEAAARTNYIDPALQMKGRLAHINDEQANKLSNVMVEKDDVLLNMTGVPVARCCVAPENVLPARGNQHVSIIRFKKNIIDAKCAHSFLISPETKFQLLKDSEGGATKRSYHKSDA